MIRVLKATRVSSLKKIPRTAGTATVLLALAMFPVIGNALAYPYELPRRAFQAAVLALGLVLLALLWREGRKRFASLRILRPGILLWPALVLLGLITFQAFLNYKKYALGPGAGTLIGLALFLGWLMLCVIVLARTFLPVLKTTLAADGRPDRHAPFWFGLIAFLLGAALALKGWHAGPPFRQVYLTFGGSTITTGVCSLIAYYSVLACSPFPLSLLFSLPYGYLIVMATARSAWLGTLVMFIPYCLFVLVRKSPGESRLRLAARVILPPVILLAVVWPVFSGSLYYPYLVPHGNRPLAKYHVFEFGKRAARMFTLFPDRLRGLIIAKWKESMGLSGLSDQDLIRKLGEKESPLLLAIFRIESFQEAGRWGEIARLMTDLEQEKWDRYLISRGEMRLYSLLIQPKAARVDLYRKSLAKIGARPTGYWPVPFETILPLDCGDGRPCHYTHNIFLTAAFDFGWVPGLVFLAGIAVLGVRILGRFLFGRNIVEKVLVVGLMGSFAQMQISGTFSDYFVALLFAWLWLVCFGLCGRTRPVRK